MQKPKIGVFGAHRGWTMIGYLVEHPEEAELVAVCDKDIPALNSVKDYAVAKGFDRVQWVTNFEDFIQIDMDACVLANYANEHAPFGMRLLESGRHIMSEVLVCATADEGLRLAETVEKTGKIYNYAENYCYFRTTAEMRTRYRRGDIGEALYGEGEYLHDCTSIWPQITYGERDHWRNIISSTYYCTHALGPLMHITGLRPVKVSGFETRIAEAARPLGMCSASHGIIMIECENGVIFKAAQGLAPKRQESINYVLYGEKGEFETDRYKGFDVLNAYIEEPGHNCQGVHTNYTPAFSKEAEEAGHGGGDFYTMHNFIRSIQGDEEAKKETIDIYEALDMSLPGILAYKSIVNGSAPVAMPNIRDKAAREIYRGDKFCTFPAIGGEQAVSPCSREKVSYPDEVYEDVRIKFEKGLPG